MKHSFEDFSIFQAWSLAWNLRCCPPDMILAAELSPELEGHLQLCPLCRRDREGGFSAIRFDLPERDASRAGKNKPQIGQLWSLAGSLSGWGAKSRYYSPPVVLVTGSAGDSAVHVVQTFGDNRLVGADDVRLDNGITGFAEPWNRYTMHNRDLEFFLGSVSEDCMQRLLRAMDNPAVSSPPGSLLWFFRQMEVETGWFFARHSIAGLLQPIVDEGIVNSRTLLEDLRELPVILPETSPDDLPETILAQTMPADDLLPMAAAGVDVRAIQILLFTVREERIRDVQTATAEVTVQTEQNGLLRISGCCDLGTGPEAVWIFRWHSDRWSIEPLPGQYGAEDGVFWAVFPVDTLDDPVEGELVVRVLVSG